MPYTTSQAIKALDRYLNISDEDKEYIPETKNRGFVYKMNDGQKVVIFVYPLVHKQDNTKNYFDTRDSGAFERNLTWRYSLEHNYKYFCFGVNDSVDKYTDYVFSLECDEKTIERISGTKDGSRSGPGNQIIIPNDYIPQKPFERIQNKLGIFIAAVSSSELPRYMQAYDNRPYMGSVDSAVLDTELVDEINEYQRAANILLKYISESGFDNPITSEYVESVRNDFLARFSPEKLAALSDDELLNAIFYSDGDNTGSLCCYIEMNKDCRKTFGGISGGSAYKFGLFKKKETGLWTSGSPLNPIEMTEDEALQRGKDIRDALVKGVEIIRNAELDSLEAYEKLDDDLKEKVGEQFYNWTWFHKYFAIVCCDKLSCYHSTEWQNHILFSFGIRPSKKYYARSGQIAMIENYAGMYYRQFFTAHVERYGRAKTFYRVGTTSDGKSALPEWIKRAVVGIGWNGLGSLKEYESGSSLSKDDITDKLIDLYYQGDNNKSTASRKAGEIIRFYDTDENAVIVAADGEKVLGLIDELGDYFYDSSAIMAHMKPGTWHLPFTDDECMPNKSEGLQTSCVQIKDEDNLMYLYDKYYYADDNKDLKETAERMDNTISENKLKNCMEITREPRQSHRYPVNFIIYGAPGTGKTYSTAEYALAILEDREVDLSQKTNEERLRVMAEYNKRIHDGQIVFTTFHQSYGYEEFIQGLRPDTTSEKMAFNVVDGVFKRIADRALNDQDNNYVIIIDEINRANISKVFGELITLIEEDKRWGEVNQLCDTLQSGDVFAVPNNLYIVGTMNSADKSISLIDAALRRRFEFIEQKPQPSLVSDTVLKSVLLSLNKSLADELESADLLIGHSYFMNKTETELPSILNNSIIPLLYEYFYDNKKKVASVLSKAIENTKIEVVDDNMGRLRVKKTES